MVLRVRRVTSSSAASAAIVTAIIAAPIGLVAAVGVTALVTVVVMPHVTRSDIHDGMARIHHDRRAISYRWRAIRHWRRAWGVHRDRTRGMKDWQRQPNREVHRNSCLGGAGQSEDRNHCDQTEQMFCFHGGSDGDAVGVFECGSLIKQEVY